MKKIIASSFAAAVLLVTAGAPAAESLALAAQKKRACQCKPTLRRRTRSATKARAVKINNQSAASGASVRTEVVGPVYATYTLPANQYFRLRMDNSISSKTARAADRFRTTVVTPVYASGVEVVPAGSIVEGTITQVTPARSRGREGQIAVAFDTLILPDGTRRSIEGALTQLQDERAGQVDEENHVTGRDSENREIIFIGGGGAGGAVLGGAMGGAKGAAIGAIIGAGAGVAGALLTKGNDVEVRSGAEIGMMTTRPIVFTVRSDRVDR